MLSDVTGALVQHLEYDPYGPPSINEGSQDVRHKFTGKEMDAGSGLYYFGARYYDPVLGRFISADPIVQNPFDPQTLNRYTYCRNNPLKYTDPTGNFLWFFAIVGAIIGAIVGGVMAAIQGTSIWKGILTGAISGFGAGFGFWGAIIWGAVSGAAGAAITGGNPGIGAGIGMFSALLGCALGSLGSGGASSAAGASIKGASGSWVTKAVGSVLISAVSGGLGSVLSGGDFITGFKYGVKSQYFKC